MSVEYIYWVETRSSSFLLFNYYAIKFFTLLQIHETNKYLVK